MSNESMANYITETPSEIAELIETNKTLESQLTEKEALLKDAKEMAEFYGIPEEHSDYSVALVSARVIKRDLEEYDYNGTKLIIAGKKAREFLAKLKAGEE